MTPLRKDAKKWLDLNVRDGVEIKSKADTTGSHPFEDLTGVRHTDLVAAWKTAKGKIRTCCGDFVSKYASELKITGITSWFNLETSLMNIGKKHAWVPATDDETRPQYGDILHHTQGGTGMHVDVCISFTEDNRLIRVGAGQTLFTNPRNPDAETDVLKRIKGTTRYDYRKLRGWLDIDRFFDPAAAVPVSGPSTNWLIGWWDVRDENQYYYHFDGSGHVHYTEKRPLTMMGPPKLPQNAGKYRFLSLNILEIKWNPLDGGNTVETFTADGSGRMMTGKSNLYSPLVAKRL